MSSLGCKPVALDKPVVWKDGYGWQCDQHIECLTCHDIWSDRLCEDGTWTEAMEATRKARLLVPPKADATPASAAALAPTLVGEGRTSNAPP